MLSSTARSAAWSAEVDALLLGAGAPFGALRVAFGSLEIGQLGAGVGQVGLEVGDVAVRGLEPLGRLGGGLGVLADRLLGLLGAFPGGLELGARPARRELVARAAALGACALVLRRGAARGDGRVVVAEHEARRRARAPG